MARMSKEAYLREMERVNEGEGRNYRVPPSVWEKPEEYLTLRDRREMAIDRGLIGVSLGLIALAVVGLGRCIYDQPKHYQKKHDEAGKSIRQIENTTNQQTTKQIRDIQRLVPLEKKVLTPRINHPATRPLHRTRNNQQLPNKNVAYPRFYHITSK